MDKFLRSVGPLAFWAAFAAPEVAGRMKIVPASATATFPGLRLIDGVQDVR